MSDSLKTFVTLNREKFDVSEPPIDVWKNIALGMKLKGSNADKGKRVAKLKYFGFITSILIVIVYVIYPKIKSEDTYVNDCQVKNYILTSVQKGVEVQKSIEPPFFVKKEPTDLTLLKNINRKSVNSVNPKTADSHHTKSCSRKFYYPDTIINSYNSITKSSDKFYSMQHIVVSPISLLMKNKTSVSLPRDSYVIVGFTHKYVIDIPDENEIVLETNGLGDADIYVSSDNVEYIYLGLASRGITRFDLGKISYKKRVKYIKIIGKDFKGKSEGFDLINVCALLEDK